MTETRGDLAKEMWDRLITPESEGGYGLNPGWYRSSMFDLLAQILAFYQAAGTTPEKMVGPYMRKRIHWLLTGEDVPEEKFAIEPAAAIRREALEEAAKVCEAMDDKYEQPRPHDCAAAIRAMMESK